MMIFKLQRPIFPTDAKILAYDERRRHVRHLTQTEELMALFEGDALKVYVNAEVSKSGKLKIGPVVKDHPNW